MPPKASTSKAKTAITAAPLEIKALLDHLVTAGGLTLSEAISVAGPLTKAELHSTLLLSQLSESRLEEISVVDEGIVKKLLAIGKSKRGLKRSDGGKNPDGTTGKKRKNAPRESDLDLPLPDSAPPSAPILAQSLDFKEEMDEAILVDKKVLTNRAPVMMAWSTVVAERLGFKRQEALSLAQTYTELNATSKGVSIGILPSAKATERPGSSQPQVDLLGRKIPVMAMQNGEWRGIIKGAISEPNAAFGYIQRSLRQQMGFVIGAMALLAGSFTAQELNEKGYGLYIHFRPSGTGWGEKTPMALTEILSLRRFLTHVPPEILPQPRAFEKVKTEEPVEAQLDDDERDPLFDDDLDEALLGDLP